MSYCRRFVVYTSSAVILFVLVSTWQGGGPGLRAGYEWVGNCVVKSLATNNTIRSLRSRWTARKLQNIKIEIQSRGMGKLSSTSVRIRTYEYTTAFRCCQVFKFDWYSYIAPSSLGFCRVVVALWYVCGWYDWNKRCTMSDGKSNINTDSSIRLRSPTTVVPTGNYVPGKGFPLVVATYQPVIAYPYVVYYNCPAATNPYWHIIYVRSDRALLLYCSDLAFFRGGVSTITVSIQGVRSLPFRCLEGRDSRSFFHPIPAILMHTVPEHKPA